MTMTVGMGPNAAAGGPNATHYASLKGFNVSKISAHRNYGTNGVYTPATVKAASYAQAAFILVDINSTQSNSAVLLTLKASNWILQGGVSHVASSNGNVCGTWTFCLNHRTTYDEKVLTSTFVGAIRGSYWGCRYPVVYSANDPLFFYNETDKQIALYWGLFDAYKDSSQLGNNVPWSGDCIVTMPAAHALNPGNPIIDNISVVYALPGTNSNWSHYLMSTTSRSSWYAS